MTSQTKVKRYPVRGALYGLLLGLSFAYFAFFQFAMFGFDTLGGVITKFVIIILVGVAIGVLWAYVAPPKRAKGPAPAAAPAAPAAPPAVESEPPAAPAAVTPEPAAAMDDEADDTDDETDDSDLDDDSGEEPV